MSPPVHLLLDYENVQPSAEEVGQMRGDRYRLWFLHGPHQKNFSAELVGALLPLGKRVSLVQIAKSGKNALDLHLAYCMGQAVEQSRAAGQSGCYVVISRDGGFDAMFGYLQRCGIRAARASTLPDALTVAHDLLKGEPAQPTRTELPPSAKTERVIEHFRAHPKTKPRNETRLHNYIGSLFGNDTPETEVRKIVNELKSRRVVAVDNGAIRYNLPTRRAAVKAAA